MGRVFKPRTEATSYTPVDGDTLAEIVRTKCEKADPPISCEEVALFNWGVKEPKEVLRALVELVGCKEVDAADVFKSKLDPARGPGGAKILLPKVWKKAGLAYEKVHKLKAKQALPPTAVSITSLDKWFVPNDESCDVGYALEGLHSRAMRVDMDVYASNYAKATATNDGEFVTYAYSDIPDTRILEKAVQADAAERSSGTESSWKGESTAADGILKPRAPAKRYLNAASSPYTVTLRYYKDDGHKKALLRLSSFWPRWSGTGGGRAVVDESLKFKWKIKDCPGGMQGHFQIFDKDGNIVWRQALPPAKCGNGEHEHNWTEGKALIAEAKMPYRVQIQVHTNKDTDPGLGLAAMHTEVRLFTHPEIGTHGVDHEREPQVLSFALAPFYSGAAPAEDSAKGRKLRLAKAGYHPGPIEDGEGQAPYIQAVREFQRDHVKPGVAPRERLKSDGTLDAHTKTAIAAQAAGRRALFADDSRADIAVEATLNTALNEKATQIVAWVEDRTNYTTVTPAHAGNLLPNMGLEDYRGGADLPGDGKQTRDVTSLCRPWLPLEAAMPLMRKGDDLQAAAPAVPAVTDAMRHATGPIRIDWTFRDTAPEYKVDQTQYNHNRVRALRYLTTAITGTPATHNGKDSFNCAFALGGIRGADYYKAPFGIGAESLMPWKGQADGGVSAVCSVAHDDLGQEAARVYEPRLGKAGVYLHPSIIGGDGYQFRAQVSFRDMPTGATHPNWKVLRERYDETKLPQAHTAPIRLWRKDSYRAHVQWAAAHHWGAFDTQCATFYEAGMVHLVQEGVGNSYRATQIFPAPGGEGRYRTLVSGQIAGGMGTGKTDRYRPAAEITLTDNFIWPWSAARHLGVHGVPPAGTALANYLSAYRNRIFNDTWRKFREPLVYVLLSTIERDKGLLRGHMVGEFRASPQFWTEKYYCNVCATDHLLIETTAGGGSGVGEDCRVGVCAGKLESSIKEDYRCDQCATVRTDSISAGVAGKACTTPCTGTMRQVSMTNLALMKRTTYRCDNCSRETSAFESNARAGAQAGTACGQACPRNGRWRAVAGSRTAQEIAGPRADLGLPSWGGPLGGLFLDTKEGPRTYWAHEVGHHKNLEHAGDVITNPAQHDRAANTVDAAVAADPDVNSQKWDRDCIMSYVNTETGPDQAYFCGKCLLKLRGWKVEGLADPGGHLGGP